MRLFVALEIPAAVRENLAALIAELRAREPEAGRNRARWVRPENLHVTLKFIGEVRDDKVAAIGVALSEVRSEGQVDARFRGLGFFPGEKRPRVLWAGLQASQNLAPLAAEVDARLSRLGFASEKREFTPHLTLARFEPPVISEPLRIAVQHKILAEFGSLRSGQMHLIQSKLKPSGAVYTTLQSFSFAR